MASSWAAVGGNPAPGDPAWIADQSTLFGSIADDAEQCAQQLQGIYGQWAPSDWRGRAADVFRTHLGLLLPDLQKVSSSYGIASEALRGFASTLADLQALAAEALIRALGAQAAAGAAANAATDAAGSLTIAKDRATTTANEITSLTDAIRQREIQLGAQAGGDPTLRSWADSLQTLGNELRGYEIQLDQAVAALQVAETQGAFARQNLANAQAAADQIGAEYQDAVSRTTATLQEASALGIRNASFLDSILQNTMKVELDVGLFVTHQIIQYGEGVVDGALGMVSGVWDLCKALWDISPERALIDPSGWSQSVQDFGHECASIGSAMVEHPGSFFKTFGEQMLNWNTFAHDPAKAIGELVPGIVLAVATAGAGTAVDAVTTTVGVADDMVGVAHAAQAAAMDTPQGSNGTGLGEAVDRVTGHFAGEPPEHVQMPPDTLIVPDSPAPSDLIDVPLD